MRARNIHTIGDLSALTEGDIHSLPIRSPKVDTVRKVLTKFGKNLVITRSKRSTKMSLDAQLKLGTSCMTVMNFVANPMQLSYTVFEMKKKRLYTLFRVFHNIQTTEIILVLAGSITVVAHSLAQFASSRALGVFLERNNGAPRPVFFFQLCFYKPQQVSTFGRGWTFINSNLSARLPDMYALLPL